MSMLETGARKQPSLPTLVRLAKVLGVPVTELLGRRQCRPPSTQSGTGRRSSSKSFASTPLRTR
ncbi:MAG: helix-turn-helix domain-containing protein [Candidatus Rokuibacteriota bacterium]